MIYNISGISKSIVLSIAIFSSEGIRMEKHIVLFWLHTEGRDMDGHKARMDLAKEYRYDP